MAKNFDRVFKALAEPSRRRIIELLCQSPCTAGDLGRRVGLAPNAVSFHLKELKETGLIRNRRDGRCIIYSVDTDGLTRWRTHVDEVFSTNAHPSKAAEANTTASVPTPAARPIVENHSEESLPTELL